MAISSSRLGEPRLDLSSLLLQFPHPHLHGGLVHTVLDSLHYSFDAPLELLKSAVGENGFQLRTAFEGFGHVVAL